MLRRDDIGGVLLAGGLSRRMGGGDKCLLDFNGGKLLEQVITRLEPQVGSMIINANGAPERFSGFGLPVVADPVGDYAGPLAGVLAGMRWGVSQEMTAVVTVATDAPFFPADLVSRLASVRAGSDSCIVMAASGGRTHPVFGLWPVALADDLEEALRSGVRKVLAWTDRHESKVCSFDFNDGVDPFFNANKPDDLDEARRLSQRSANGEAA